MLTNGEIENTRKLELASKRFEASVNKLVKLEAMKAENKARERINAAPLYTSSDFMKLLGNE